MNECNGSYLVVSKSTYNRNDPKLFRKLANCDIPSSIEIEALTQVLTVVMMTEIDLLTVFGKKYLNKFIIRSM